MVAAYQSIHKAKLPEDDPRLLAYEAGNVLRDKANQTIQTATKMRNVLSDRAKDKGVIETEKPRILELIEIVKQSCENAQQQCENAQQQLDRLSELKIYAIKQAKLRFG